MPACRLDPLVTYDVGRVIHDSADNKLTIQLTNPPPTCPDRVLNTHTGEVRVSPVPHALVMFDSAKGHAVVLVPKQDMVEEVEHTSVATVFLVLLAIAIGAAALYYFIKWLLSDNADDGQEEPPPPLVAGMRPHPSGSGGGGAKASPYSKEQNYHPTNRIASAPAPAPTTVVVNNQHSSGDGLLTGLVLGEMLSGHHDREVVHEREVIRERVEPAPAPAPSSSSDDDDSSSSSSRSFESDSSSSSSFSSDSDSSSSFSSDSDSSSSFSSDSGGSSFGDD